MEEVRKQNIRIPRVDAVFFAIVLETVLQQMYILEGCIKLELNLRLSTSGKSRGTKSELEKLSQDRKITKDVISTTLLHLTQNGKFSSLSETVNKLKCHATATQHLKQIHEKLKRLKSDLASKVHLEKYQHNEKLNSIEEFIAVFRDAIEDSKLNISTRLLYADKWLKAKAETYNVDVPTTNFSVTRLNNEIRVHKEIIMTYEIAIKEKEDDVEYWRNRFANDIAHMNERIATKREQLENTISKCNELQQLLNLHAGEMTAWLTFKRERAARVAREERARISVTRIQAWWRGVMVRRALGAFKHLRHGKKNPAKLKKKTDS